jgi:hypothetical protein
VLPGRRSLLDAMITSPGASGRHHNGNTDTGAQAGASGYVTYLIFEHIEVETDRRDVLTHQAGHDVAVERYTRPDGVGRPRLGRTSADSATVRAEPSGLRSGGSIGTGGRDGVRAALRRVGGPCEPRWPF